MMEKTREKRQEWLARPCQSKCKRVKCGAYTYLKPKTIKPTVTSSFLAMVNNVLTSEDYLLVVVPSWGQPEGTQG